MRFDKLTTKLQEALGEAQSLALGEIVDAPHHAGGTLLVAAVFRWL